MITLSYLCIFDTHVSIEIANLLIRFEGNANIVKEEEKILFPDCGIYEMMRIELFE
jgi:hypothetical protein